MVEPSASDLSVSIIVPVHNGGDAFRRCLQALIQLTPSPDEIIVIADGVTDGSERLAESFEGQAGIRVVETPARAGPARARNLGTRQARGDILFFIDADVLVYPNAIGLVRSIFERQPDLAAVFGCYDDAPGQPNFLSQYKNLLHHYVHLTSNEDASTFWSGCGAIRREVFFSLGGYDEHFDQPAIEDIELGYRLKKQGYRIRLDKTLQVKHLKYWSASSLLKTDFFQRALPWTQLILRERRFIDDLNLRRSSRISVGLVYGLLAAMLGATWQPVAGLTVAGSCAVALLAINRSLYKFFFRKRGWWFTLWVIPWHWGYYGYSGLAFALGLIRYYSRQALIRIRPLGKPGRVAVDGKGPE